MSKYNQHVNGTYANGGDDGGGYVDSFSAGDGCDDDDVGDDGDFRAFLITKFGEWAHLLK